MGRGYGGCVSGGREGEVVGVLVGMGRGYGGFLSGGREGDMVGLLVGGGKGKWWVC